MKRKRPAPLNTKFGRFRVQALWVIRTTFRTSPALLLGILVTSVLANLLPAALAWIAKKIVDAVAGLIAEGGGSGIEPVIPWLILGFSLAILSELLGSLNAYLKHRMDETLQLRLSTDILEHSASLDIGQLEDPEMQDVFERVQKNPAGHFSAFLMKLINLFAQIIQMVSLVVILFAVEPLILLILLPVLFPYIYSKWRHSQNVYHKEYSRATKRRWAGYFTSILTGRNSAPETKILGLAPTLIDKYVGLLREFIAEDRRLFIRRTLMEMAYAIVLGSATYFLMARIVGRISAQALTIGDLVLFIAVSARLRSSLNSVAEAASGAVAELLYIADLNLFFGLKPNIRRRAGNLTPKISGKIEFRDVRFIYPGSTEVVLHGISFTVEKGETVAIVGENGSGKTTLVKLIARLYDPTEGSILIDDLDSKRISPSCLHSQLAFAMQGFNRYEATVFDNIAYGHITKGLTPEDLDRVAAETDTKTLIDMMPQGYDTLLGRRFGVYDLSFGMWQKIALARTFTREDAALLILDEPTAALDARAEYRLFLKFASLAKGRTTLLISHRFSTVRLADRIIVLDRGHIIETGTHDALIARKGRYAELYNMHAKQMGAQDERQ